MRITHQLIAALGFVLSFSTAQAQLTEIPISGKVNVVKGWKLVKFVSKSKQQPGEAPFPLPVPGGASDPTVGGAILAFEDSNDPQNADSYVLSSLGWTGLGNPPGTKGYKYNGNDGGGPCAIVLLKEKVIKAVCKPSLFGLMTPFVGTNRVFLNLPIETRSTQYCAEFGGEEKKNDSTIMKRKNAPPPETCPAFCGNNQQEGTEECDGTADGACSWGCDLDCTCLPEPVCDPYPACYAHSSLAACASCCDILECAYCSFAGEASCDDPVLNQACATVINAVGCAVECCPYLP